MSQDILNKAAEALGVDVDDLKKSALGELLGDLAPTQKEEPTLEEKVGARYAVKEEAIGPERMRFHEKVILLNVLDSQWKDHLLSMDHLKDGIGLRGYGQRDPLQEYKRESFELFRAMSERIEDECVRFLFLLEPMSDEERAEQERRERERRQRQFVLSAPGNEGVRRPEQRKEGKVGRNQPCPCGSGRKYKKCHGA